MLALSVEQALLVINELHDIFDSHDFIIEYIRFSRQTERDYVEDLYAARNSTDGIFKTYHRQLGAFLLHHSLELDIEPIARRDSANIKDYESSNMSWRKTRLR